MPFTMWFTMTNLITVGRTTRAYLWRSARKLSHSSAHFESHSRLSYLTGIDRYIRLSIVIHSNLLGPILCRFKDVEIYGSKIAKYSDPRLFQATV